MNKKLSQSIAAVTDKALSDVRETLLGEVQKANAEAIERATDELDLITDMMTAVAASKEEMVQAFRDGLSVIEDEMKKRHDKLHQTLSAQADAIKARLVELNPAA